MTERVEIDKALSELRTEVYEARNLVIKSDNLLRTLHAEVKSVGKTQERFEKRHLFSSIAAYVLFAGLAAAGAVYINVSTSGAIRASAEQAIEDAAESVRLAEEKAADATAELQAKIAVEEDANSVFELINSDSLEERADALRALESLDMTLVPRIIQVILKDKAQKVREEIVTDAWPRARRAYLADNMEEAIPDLESIFVHSAHLPFDFERSARLTATYYLGAAQHRLGNYDESAMVLAQYVRDKDAPRNTLAYANLLLAESLEKIGRIDEALEASNRGLAIEPTGRHSPALRRLIESIGRE